MPLLVSSSQKVISLCGGPTQGAFIDASKNIASQVQLEFDADSGPFVKIRCSIITVKRDGSKDGKWIIVCNDTIRRLFIVFSTKTQHGRAEVIES